MGTVFLAEDQLEHRRVAVKRLSLEGLGPSAAAERVRQFAREAELLARLRHPQLPQVLDFFLDEGQPYLVMELVEGQNLDDLLHLRGPLPEATVRDFMAQLANLLVYLHSQTVVFRDLKPSNVILSGDRLMLVDFGIAKELAPTGGDTQTGARGLLSTGYSAPEQYAGGTGPDSDLYGLGATAYTLLNGQPPPCSLERLLGEARLAPLRSDVSLELSDLIEECLAPRREQRPPGAESVVARLARMPVPGSPRPLRPPPSVEPPTARHPLRLPRKRVSLPVLALGSVIGLMLLFHPPPPFKLNVTSDPPGARVMLGDRELGTTPCQAWAPPGPALVTVVKEGYLPEPFMLEGFDGTSHALQVELRPGRLPLEDALMSPENHPEFFPYGRGPVPGRDPASWERLQGLLAFRVPPGYRLEARTDSLVALSATGVTASVRIEPDRPDLLTRELEAAQREGWTLLASEGTSERGFLRLERGGSLACRSVRRLHGQRALLMVECAPGSAGTDLVRAYDVVRNSFEPRF